MVSMSVANLELKDDMIFEITFGGSFCACSGLLLFVGVFPSGDFYGSVLSLNTFSLVF